MKKLFCSMILCFVISTLSLQAKTIGLNFLKADTTIDPKKHPGEVDLRKNPEIMARIRENLKNGKIAFSPKNENMDTTLDLSKHPELVKAIIKNPSNWPVILKAYNKNNDTLAALGKNKQVIRDILSYLISKHIVKEQGDVDSFLLTNDVLTVNGNKLSDVLHYELKQKYIKASDYVVYYGNSEMKGNGIFQRRDNL